MARYLNLACGATRPGRPWVNMDTLFGLLGGLAETGDPGAKDALKQLQEEPNYIDHDMLALPWPQFSDESVHGILCSHALEHLTVPQALAVLGECRRVLEPEGVLRLSVPDAAYFRKVYDRDRPENWQELFGEANVTPKKTYLDYALFFEAHMQAFTEDSLWAELVNAGFLPTKIRRVNYREGAEPLMAGQDNRPKFSLFMEACK